MGLIAVLMGSNCTERITDEIAYADDLRCMSVTHTWVTAL